MNGFNEIKTFISSGQSKGIRIGTNLKDQQEFKTPTIKNKALWRTDRSTTGWDLFFVIVVPNDAKNEAMKAIEVSFTENQFEELEPSTSYTANVAKVKGINRLQSIEEA